MRLPCTRLEATEPDITSSHMGRLLVGDRHYIQSPHREKLICSICVFNERQRERHITERVFVHAYRIWRAHLRVSK